ncbi:D-glycero-beta-D-manno-heptose 1,7-bisphosphate 7-phosphatase [Lachnospiraceae bacterium ASD3451]|uniref:D-glycero-beta-D-manno-heptose 1,7-bisphosphate 7-phosphatase n=1 Tax=Diplocloster agilis TaxID=2850323 RepID=UPI001DAB2784|nr:D-glycero-beta-D-manno-heptose 1,7-bisphosphate 7-phosphatase [Diplocloster agilis]MBU9743095.1 D-glycero-beta-D-manno-heptose 1,7-bisphosphate 7-phosphatase [Diplocloster agilis]
MKIVIMAGGKGTRIAALNSEIPKPMFPINGKPILEYQIECLRDQGYEDIILIVGHLGHVIKEYFGDGNQVSQSTGKAFGVHIEYIVEEEPLGTAGALYLLKDKLTESFLLLNGDVIFDIDIERFKQYHISKGGDATLLVHPNNHPYDSGIVVVDEEGRVLKWLHKEDKRTWYKNLVNSGIHMLSPNVLDKLTQLKKIDLDREILKPMVEEEKLYAYHSTEYIKDMGTPERLNIVSADINQGLVQAKNLSNKQKAIFIDRDGTINKYVGFLRNIDDFELIEGVAEAIRIINQSGYLTIVITNQPVIARGEVSIPQLNEIHNKMETLLGNEGAYLDDIFYCPHHPDTGYEGEIPEYKKVCDCRKPKPGLIIKAAKKYNIDLEQSWMIGDEETDVTAGILAGCHVMRIDEKSNHAKSYPNLLTCVTEIFCAK